MEARKKEEEVDRRETARKREQEGDPQVRSETTGERQGEGGRR